jgi:hypothetical protein
MLMTHSLLEPQDHVPTEGHDVSLTAVLGAHHDDRPWLEEAADLGKGKVLFSVGSHSDGSLEAPIRFPHLPFLRES